MKTMLKIGAAAFVIAGLAGVASAQHTTSQTTYSNSIISGWSTPAVNIGPLHIPATGSEDAWKAAQGIGSIKGLGVVKAASGSRYHQELAAPDNTEKEFASESNSFTLTGNVTKDCSFYGGGQTGHSIALGTIGVRTGNNDNVSIAFNQRDAITANVNSATAGCNTNNTVTISKTNGSAGLLNNQPGNFDSAQFTDRIPYTISASWTGVAAGTTGVGTTQSLVVGDNQGTNNKQGGAWRSTFNMDVNAPAQSKGLVAGDYTDTITVTLAAL